MLKVGQNLHDPRSDPPEPVPVRVVRLERRRECRLPPKGPQPTSSGPEHPVAQPSGAGGAAHGYVLIFLCCTAVSVVVAVSAAVLP